MRRVISVFLPTWPTDLLRRFQSAAVPSADKPLVTTMHDGRRQVVAGADRAARALGLVPGMPVAQGQALVPGLTVIPATPDRYARVLEEAAAWCLRYAPLTAPDKSSGLWIDATGSTHLFGGETATLADIIERLSRSGITSRAAIADTPGAAWAMARYGTDAITSVGPGEAPAALRSLPVAAL
jgi:protein ImuB